MVKLFLKDLLELIRISCKLVSLLECVSETNRMLESRLSQMFIFHHKRADLLKVLHFIEVDYIVHIKHDSVFKVVFILAVKFI